MVGRRAALNVHRARGHRVAHAHRARRSRAGLVDGGVVPPDDVGQCVAHLDRLAVPRNGRGGHVVAHVLRGVGSLVGVREHRQVAGVVATVDVKLRVGIPIHARGGVAQLVDDDRGLLVLGNEVAGIVHHLGPGALANGKPCFVKRPRPVDLLASRSHRHVHAVLRLRIRQVGVLRVAALRDQVAVRPQIIIGDGAKAARHHAVLRGTAHVEREGARPGLAVRAFGHGRAVEGLQLQRVRLVCLGVAADELLACREGELGVFRGKHVVEKGVDLADSTLRHAIGGLVPTERSVLGYLKHRTLGQAGERHRAHASALDGTGERKRGRAVLKLEGFALIGRIIHFFLIGPRQRDILTLLVGVPRPDPEGKLRVLAHAVNRAAGDFHNRQRRRLRFGDGDRIGDARVVAHRDRRLVGDGGAAHGEGVLRHAHAVGDGLRPTLRCVLKHPLERRRAVGVGLCRDVVVGAGVHKLQPLGQRVLDHNLPAVGIAVRGGDGVRHHVAHLEAVGCRRLERLRGHRVADPVRGRRVVADLHRGLVVDLPAAGLRGPFGHRAAEREGAVCAGVNLPAVLARDGPRDGTRADRYLDVVAGGVLVARAVLREAGGGALEPLLVERHARGHRVRHDDLVHGRGAAVLVGGAVDPLDAVGQRVTHAHQLAVGVREGGVPLRRNHVHGLLLLARPGVREHVGTLNGVHVHIRGKLTVTFGHDDDVRVRMAVVVDKRVAALVLSDGHAVAPGLVEENLAKPDVAVLVVARVAVFIGVVHVEPVGRAAFLRRDLHREAEHAPRQFGRAVAGEDLPHLRLVHGAIRVDESNLHALCGAGVDGPLVVCGDGGRVVRDELLHHAVGGAVRQALDDSLLVSLERDGAAARHAAFYHGVVPIGVAAGVLLVHLVGVLLGQGLVHRVAAGVCGRGAQLHHERELLLGRGYLVGVLLRQVERLGERQRAHAQRVGHLDRRGERVAVVRERDVCGVRERPGTGGGVDALKRGLRHAHAELDGAGLVDALFAQLPRQSGAVLLRRLDVRAAVHVFDALRQRVRHRDVCLGGGARGVVGTVRPADAVGQHVAHTHGLAVEVGAVGAVHVLHVLTCARIGVGEVNVVQVN